MREARLQATGESKNTKHLGKILGRRPTRIHKGTTFKCVNDVALARKTMKHLLRKQNVYEKMINIIFLLTHKQMLRLCEKIREYFEVHITVW